MKAAKPHRDSQLAVDKMTDRQAQREHARLEAEIKKHDEAYYQKDAPTVSDADYDALRQRYNAIEERFPDLRTLESLSRKVGAAPARGFAKVRHAVPMLSLDNAFNETDVADFVARIRRFLNLKDDEELAFTAEPKIDGLSMSLRYEGGELKVAATRGDGAEGEDVTANVKTLKDVPHKLKGRKVPDDLRGARRGLHDQGRLSRAQQAPGGGGRPGLRQSAQLGGGLAAAEGFEHHRVAAAALLRLCLGRDERDAGGHPVRHDQVARRHRLSRQPEMEALPLDRRAAGISP